MILSLLTIRILGFVHDHTDHDGKAALVLPTVPCSVSTATAESSPGALETLAIPGKSQEKINFQPHQIDIKIETTRTLQWLISIFSLLSDQRSNSHKNGDRF